MHRKILAAACFALALGCASGARANDISVPCISIDGVSVNCAFVGPANPVPVTAGPYSYSPSSTANSDQHNLAITTATALTVPADATFAQVCVTGTKVNYRWDGTAPTATVGQPLSSGQCFFFQGRSILTALQFIQTAATATLDVTYSK